MKSLYSAASRYSLVVLALIVVGLVISGQGMGKSGTRTGYPEDWSHHSLVFSAPRDAAQAVAMSKDPRYQQQWLRRNAAPSVKGGSEIGSGGSWYTGDNGGSAFTGDNPLHRDWSATIGTSGSVGAGHYPAKYSFDITTANCSNAATPDYVVFNTGAPGAGSQASLVAFDNIYAGCSSHGSVPTVYWAVATGGAANTSPVLSADGTQVAFAQTDNITGAADLVVLSWATGGTVTAPATPTTEAASSYKGCGAPCMTVIALADGNTDSNSSAFYDYAEDIIYVGDDGGILHKITGVFNGVPTEVMSGGWPATVSGTILTSPVSDHDSGNVFVGAADGILYSVVASTGVVTASGTLGGGTGIAASPVVNSTLGHVYAFLGEDRSASACIGGSTAHPCNGVYEFSTTSFTSGGLGTEVALGPAALGTIVLYPGDFDNTFYTSPSGTGSMYVCGQDSSGLSDAALYKLTISAGVATSAQGGAPLLTSSSTTCSPVTEFYNPNLNGGTDQIFWSVENHGYGANCGSVGCINSANITAWQASHTYAIGEFVLDSNFDMEVVVSVSGMSGAMAPPWPAATTVGATTTDSGVTWISQGVPTGRYPSGWTASHSYIAGSTILDNHGNYEYTAAGGTSGTSTPSWTTTIGATTTDNTVTWKNLAAPTAFSFEATGGTSGIIIDNTVTTGGGSQLYFSNLGHGTPICGAGDGCAIQVSQAALK